MASADITNKNTVLFGVQSLQNLIRSEAHLIDGAEHSGLLAQDTHDLFTIPAGNAVVGVTIVSLESAASEGSATAQIKTKVGTGTAEAVHTAIGKADLAAGDISTYFSAKILGYTEDKATTVQLAVGTAAFTALKLMVIVHYVPVQELLTRG